MKLRRPRRFAFAVVTGALVGGTLAYGLRARPAPEPAAPEPELGEVRRGRFEDADLERRRLPARLVPVAAGVGQPTDLAFVPGHRSKLVVTSKWGSLHLVDLEAGTRTDWIWLPVTDALESGVLGLAFAPDFAQSGRFFVHQTPRSEDGSVTSAITELRVNPTTLEAPEVVADMLRVAQPHGTHNAGQIAFGPDGLLYVAFGDGHAGNPERRSQDLGSLHGSLLRLDASTPGQVAIPPGNPFVAEPGVRPEIWAYGLRNPWRFTFDGQGRAIVADVGQSRWEEVNVVAAGDNLGWPDREGTDCYPKDEPCREGDFVDPVLVYDHLDGISITGGVVWQAPGPLEGAYLFGDFGTGRLWAAHLPEAGAGAAAMIALGRFDVSPSAFARDSEGRVFLTDFRMERVYRIDLAL
ncbi:MAG: PQQ-dependent sugar dehydrogenase [Myxococcota bacterium]